jgi:hypothetical protein
MVRINVFASNLYGCPNMKRMGIEIVSVVLIVLLIGIVGASFAEDDSYDSSTATWNKTVAINTWKDSTMVIGEIKNFQKSFVYQSGFKV